MAIEWLKIRIEMKKGVIFAIRGSFRSVCSHPFLVGFLCFLILLYRSSPFIFSLLVSTSPILICTAVLLGVLLSYGEPNIPEIEIEERKPASAHKNDGHFIGRFSKAREVGSDDDATPLIIERLPSFESNDGEIGQENGVLSEKIKIEEVLESDGEKSEAESFDSEKVNVDSLDSPPRSPWKRIEEEQDQIEEEEEREEEEEEREEEEGDDDNGERAKSSDSGSDRAESLSPDASMADIMPMLDELHPLLDEDASQTVQSPSHSGSDVASSGKSSSRSHDSDDESENHENTQGENQGGSESAITWTEEDQKNLMDLGSSEIERNQRLENLILRRRARKSMAAAQDRNLIDLAGIEYPFGGLAPISTARHNPFDLPPDSYDDLGLPPIPGSAPSVLGPKRNPFDIPYGPNEEKPDLKGDGFKEEFVAFQPREAVFRRHESFNVGPSVFGPGRRDARMRPYFVPEGTISEDSGCSSFRRQSSGLSESKVSSVPETESVVSVEDFEDKKMSEEDSSGQGTDNAFEVPLGDQELMSHQEEEENREPEPISKIENFSMHVGHGGLSSEDDEESSELDRVKNRELEVQLEDFADHSRESSPSSLSEVSERVFTEIENGERQYGVVQEPGILTQTSMESTNAGALLVDVPQRAPVYDASPRHIEHDMSAASLISPLRRECDEGDLGIEMGIHNSSEILPKSVTHHTDEAQSMDIVDGREHNYMSTDFSEVTKESAIESFPADSGSTPEVENLNEEHGLREVCGSRAEETIVDIDESSKERDEVCGSLSEVLMRDEHGMANEERETLRSQDSNVDAYERADQKLISTPSVEESSVLVEPSEVVQITQNFSMPDAQEPDRNIPSNNSSKSRPELVPNLSATIEAADSHAKLQATIEEVDDIKGIDEELLSELDNVGDFSVHQWGHGSSDIEKRTGDSVEDSFLHDTKLSNTRVACIESDESGRFEDGAHLEKSREAFDFHEHEVKTKKGGAEQFVSFDLETSGNKTVAQENEAPSAYPVADQRGEYGLSGVPEIQVQPDEEIVYFSIRDELASAENETTHQGQVDAETISEMVELEATKIEDIDLAFKEIIIPKEQPESKPVVQATLADAKIVSFSDQPELASVENEITYQGRVDTETKSQIVEIEAHKSRDIDLAIQEVTNTKEQQKPEPVFQETLTDEKNESFPITAELACVENEVTYRKHAGTETMSEMVEIGARKMEDIDRALKEIITTTEPPKGEPVVQETMAELISVGKEPTHQGIYTDSTPQMVELETRKIEDLNLAVEEVISKESSPEAKPVFKETLPEHPKNDALDENSSETESTNETQAVEVTQVEKDATFISTPSLSDTGDCARETFSKVHVSEIVLSESTTTLPRPVNVVLARESLENDESNRVEADRAGPDAVETSVQEIGVKVGNPDVCEAPPKDKLCKTSSLSSGSSSSSESGSSSSSSDSEKE